MRVALFLLPGLEMAAPADAFCVGPSAAGPFPVAAPEVFAAVQGALAMGASRRMIAAIVSAAVRAARCSRLLQPNLDECMEMVAVPAEAAAEAPILATAL